MLSFATKGVTSCWQLIYTAPRRVDYRRDQRSSPTNIQQVRPHRVASDAQRVASIRGCVCNVRVPTRYRRSQALPCRSASVSLLERERLEPDHVLVWRYRECVRVRSVLGAYDTKVYTHFTRTARKF